MSETESAAAAYTEFCLREEDKEVKCFEDQSDFYNALQYLANYHLKKGELDDAYTYAYRCLEFEEVSKIFLKVFNNLRLNTKKHLFLENVRLLVG